MSSINDHAAPHDDQVRDLAYRLWEQDGCPEGRQDEYWHAAERRLSDRMRAVPAEPADPHPSDEDSRNVHNPNPGGDSVVEGRDGDLTSNPSDPGSVA